MENTIKKFNYSLKSYNDEIKKKDHLVANNDELVIRKKSFYDKLGNDVSDHIKFLNKRRF